MMSDGVQPIAEVNPVSESVETALYEKIRAFGLTREQFATTLHEIAAKYLPAESSSTEREELYASLRLEELALARACAAGNEPAWEVFMLRYREKLYDIASYIAKERSAA